MRWKLALPAGHSSPCIWGDRIFLTGHVGTTLKMICVQRSDGKVLWERERTISKLLTYEHVAGSPANSTPALTRRLISTFTEWFGTNRVTLRPPTTGGEDFSEFRRQGVPICIWSIGATDPAKIAESERTGVPVPSNHSATFAPIPEPTLKACVTSMTAAVLELMGKTRP